MKFTMRFITAIIILLLLVSCVPTEAQIQEAIMQTQTAQPTATNTPEPTATPAPTTTATPAPTTTATPEYCETTEFIRTFGIMRDMLGDYNERIQIFSKLVGVDWQSEIVILTKIKRKLDAVEVPECLVYLKQLLADSLSNSISAGTYMLAGSISEATVSLIKTTTNMRLFAEEVERLGACFPNCNP